MANKQKINDENVAELLSSLKENQDKILKQMSASTDKYNKTYSREQKSLLDLAIRNLNKIRDEEIKNIELRIQQFEILKEQTVKKHNDEYQRRELELKKEKNISDKLALEREKRFNEFQEMISKEQEILANNDIEMYERHLKEVELKKNALEESEKNLIEQNKKIKENRIELDKLNVQLAINYGEVATHADIQILNLKKQKEETQRIRKEQAEEYIEKSRQQRLINDLYYESIRKQKESLGFGNRVIDEFTGVFSMFGEGTKILGTSSKFLLDVMTKPSKKKIEKKVQTDFGGTTSIATPLPTPEIPNPEPEVEKKQPIEPQSPPVKVEKKQPIEPQSPPVKVEKKQPVEQPVKQSTVEKQILEEKTTNNIEKSKISLNREERYQKTYEAFKNIKDNPRVKKKEIYNASRRKSAKSDIENKSDNTLGDIVPIEKAEDKKEEKNRFEKLNKSIDGVRDSVEKTQGFAMLQMIQMLGIMGGLAITMGLWYDLWKQHEKMTVVAKELEKDRTYREQVSDAQKSELDKIEKEAESSGRFTKEEIEDYKVKKEKYDKIRKKQQEREKDMAPSATKGVLSSALKIGTFGLIDTDFVAPLEKYLHKKGEEEENKAFVELTQSDVMKKTKGALTKIRRSEPLTEHEKSEIERKQKEEIKTEKIDSEKISKITEEDKRIAELQRVTTEVENAKMKSQKEAGTPSVTVNVPTNDESTSLLGDILDVLSNRQPTRELK